MCGAREGRLMGTGTVGATTVNQSKTRGPPRNARAALVMLSIAIVGLLLLTMLALLQEPPDSEIPALMTSYEWWLAPHETNAFLRRI